MNQVKQSPHQLNAWTLLRDFAPSLNKPDNIYHKNVFFLLNAVGNPTPASAVILIIAQIINKAVFACSEEV